MKNNLFNFFVGIDIDDDILKASQEAKGKDRYKNMIIKGLASDSSVDSEGESMEPDGFDIDDFLKGGLLNLEHYTTRKGDPQYWIGEPRDGYVKNNEFYVEGKLWEHHPLARNFWDTCLIMKASGSTRKPGFSIEGKALQRHPLNKKKVTKAKINHCAVTMAPVNKNSFFDIVKGEQKDDFIKPNLNLKSSSKYIYEFEYQGKQYGMTKSFEIEDKEKAVTTTISEPLRRESLDKDVKDLLQKALRKKLVTPEKVYYFIKKFRS